MRLYEITVSEGPVDTLFTCKARRKGGTLHVTDAAVVGCACYFCEDYGAEVQLNSDDFARDLERDVIDRYWEVIVELISKHYRNNSTMYTNNIKRLTAQVTSMKQDD